MGAEDKDEVLTEEIERRVAKHAEGCGVTLTAVPTRIHHNLEAPHRLSAGDHGEGCIAAAQLAHPYQEAAILHGPASTVSFGVLLYQKCTRCRDLIPARSSDLQFAPPPHR